MEKIKITIFKKKLIESLTLLLTQQVMASNITDLKTEIAEESFQMQVVAKILKKMGHKITITNDVGYDIAIQTITDNAKSADVYLMAGFWDPLQKSKITDKNGKLKVAKFGDFISGCAQGYLIDKKTATKHNIKYYNDLKKPEIAKIFDSNGNGKADLAGCDAGWGCEKVIEHQLDAYKLRGTVEHNQGKYSAIIADTIARYKVGKPILYYTWTPYWVSGKLVPGRDVVFLQVKESAHPNGTSTKLENGMDFGFNVNTQRIITNISVNKNHKSLAKLFELIKIDVNDISGQNMLMSKGQNKEKDVLRHADLWLDKNKAKVELWIKTAQDIK
jgi:glycine betaine/proline transport system substrate-binding protein